MLIAGYQIIAQIYESANSLVTDLEQGLWLYFQEEFTAARQYFERVLQVNDRDLAARLYLERCALSQQTGLNVKWEEVDVLRKKR
jgi:hypothetical protein